MTNVARGFCVAVAVAVVVVFVAVVVCDEWVAAGPQQRGSFRYN